MRLRLLAFVTIALALSGCASGGSRSGRDNAPIRALLSADAMLFVGFDTDHDMSTTAAEVQAGVEREFARADANHDGSLQPIEFQNWSNIVLGGSQLGPYRLDFDRNVDNAITREEFDHEIQARVRDYDADENGALARSEFVRLVGQARPPTDRRMQQPMQPQPR